MAAVEDDGTGGHLWVENHCPHARRRGPVPVSVPWNWMSSRMSLVRSRSSAPTISSPARAGVLIDPRV